MALQTQDEDGYYYILETSTQVNEAFFGTTLYNFLQLLTKKMLSDLY